jgi:hypothetical protein
MCDAASNACPTVLFSVAVLVETDNAFKSARGNVHPE